MRYFLNPITISDEDRAIIFFFKATIAVVVFFILFGLTLHIYRKNKNDSDGSDDNKSKKNLISLIIADVFVLAFVIVILAILD